MAPAKLWLSIFLTGFAVYTGLLFQTLITPIPYGDLARIGRISDHEFGWRIEPPRVAATLLDAAPIEQAEILVIGDSFSATHLWQSRLAEKGHAVTTIFWDSIDNRLCDNFDDWLAAAGFRGKLVIAESVERLLALRLTNSQKCGDMTAPLAARVEPLSPPPDHVPGFALNWDAQIVSGWLTARCTRAAIAGKVRRDCDQQTQALPVENGCLLFSHRRCDMALFLRGDQQLGEIAPMHLTQMQAFTQAHAKVPILWMVVPNKWTTYLEPSHSQAFVKALRQTDLGPDLFTFAVEEKTKMKDFYFPNDTHISTQGQLVLGDRMVKAVEQKLGAATAPAGD
ncbi:MULTISPECIES: hypothetical protein [Variovorax]|jgi:hypothetical protein|uniref:hypothetical protein n=1 Tax=Variovorax TaxID=34072 RepID=UPI00086D8463|nr:MULTISPECIES: hypothetical protein [Variovorax]MBN8754245.1 hypothetical protein [Variovorax sp.]ODU18540.1 MAG: hypothetical protein ABS94_03925 [Variovorax sp. SCN 67-85]ODV25477.1 MAG: hypothetical protein ABT25_10210 [Variovorax sp. SCN 67-20]OJZ05027.1 MAG: hypothetical protein BGP22_13490 [Variovorax sp. 67-131]UKI09052.1 hypothetical protein L3V85_04125 [Variovorax paradoxus]